MNENDFERIYQLHQLNEKKETFFDYPKINLKSFDYQKIANCQQCYEGFKYITHQIMYITDLIKWLTDEQPVWGSLTEAISPEWENTQRRINICYNNVELVSQQINTFLTEGVITRPNGRQFNILLENCIALRDRVNNQTRQVMLLVNQYNESKDKAKRRRSLDTFPSLEGACNTYNLSVVSFNRALEAYRNYYQRNFNIEPEDLEDAEQVHLN